MKPRHDAILNNQAFMDSLINQADDDKKARYDRFANKNRLRLRSYCHKYKALKISNTPLNNHHNKNDVINLVALQKNKCAFCRKKLTAYHIDHVTPLSKGGDNSRYNIQLLCPFCNVSKKDIMPNDYALKIGLVL